MLSGLNTLEKVKFTFRANTSILKENKFIKNYPRGEKLLRIMNYNIKENKIKEFQEFIKKNEKTKAAHAPKGWKYLGTYFYVLGFGPYHAAVMWEITDYADLDALRDHNDPIFWNIIEQFLDLTAHEPTPGWLLREVGDTQITEPKKP